MSTLDPNWFYSSLAQSAAAIVGLLGAISAARLQDQLIASREQKLIVLPQLKTLHSLLIQLHSPMSDYLEHAQEQLKKLREAIAGGVGQLQEKVWYSYTEKSGPAAVEVSPRILDIEQARIQDAGHLLPLITPHCGPTR